MSGACDYCISFEFRLRRLWATLFPGEPYQTADAALDFLQIELEHLREQHQPQPEIARTGREIALAHDTLVTAITNDVLNRAVFGTDQLKLMRSLARTDPLCWVLGHTHNPAFEREVQEVQTVMARLGYQMTPRDEEGN
jgi:hypothetical protein